MSSTLLPVGLGHQTICELFQTLAWYTSIAFDSFFGVNLFITSVLRKAKLEEYLYLNGVLYPALAWKSLCS